MKRKVLFMFVLMCAVAQWARAESVTFNVRSWNDTNKEVVTADDTKDATVIEGDHPDDWIGLENGYYVAKGTVNYKVLNILGKDVHLILADECQLNCKHIKLEEGKTLHIHSQSDGETRGRLSAENKKAVLFGQFDAVYADAAPIGGAKNANMGSLYVHGGYIHADQAYFNYAAGIGGGTKKGIGGEVVIYGGEVDAHTTHGAAIGGGRESSQGGPITIYGGIVNAVATEESGTGIGGGSQGNGGVVNIYGGTVTAKGGTNYKSEEYYSGTGIGGGEYGGEVHIYGGTVYALGGWRNACIGGYHTCGNGTLEIADGMEVTWENTPVAYQERVAKCQSTSSTQELCLKISPCNHEGTTYTYSIGNDTYHTRYCGYCNHPTVEAHSLEATCVCGRDGTTKTFTLWVPDTQNGGYKQLESYTVNVYNDFYLPKCNVVPNGYAFKGWEMNPDPATLNRYYAVLGGDVNNDVNLPAGSSVKAILGQGNANFYARYLYDYTDSWTWADDASFASVTLHCDVIDTDDNYTTTNGGVTIGAPEDLKDNGNIYGKRYMARFTFEKHGYEYRFGSLQNVMNRLTLADGSDNATAISNAKGKTMRSVTLEGRTLYRDGSWNTLCLPFTLTFDNKNPLFDASDVRLLTSTGYENGTLTINFSNNNEIPAGTPFIAKWENEGEGDITNPEFDYVTIPKNVAAGSSTPDNGYVSFTGSFSPMSLTANDKSVLYLGADNKLYWPSVAMTVGSCRAVFQLKGGIEAGDLPSTAKIRLNFGEEETTSLSEKGIVKSEKFATATGWYTLDGRKLSGKPACAGIYINNCKKVVIK